MTEREPMSNEERIPELAPGIPWVCMYCDLVRADSSTICPVRSDGIHVASLLASTEPEQPASEGEEKPASGLATFAEARAQWEEENPHGEPSTTEEQPTIAPGKKWSPAALEEWTPEQWAAALDAARSDLMCAEDFEPSDVAHVMNICAQVLRLAPKGDTEE